MASKQSAELERTLEIILNDYNHSNERIETFLNRQDTIIQIAIAILGGSIAYTLTNPIPDEFYLIISSIPIIFFIQVAYHYTRIIANQGYRKYLESKLNELLEKSDHLKYSLIAEKFLLNNNPFLRMNSVIFPIIILVCILFSVIMSNYNLAVIIGNIFNLILFLIVLWHLSTFTWNLKDEVHEFCIQKETENAN